MSDTKFKCDYIRVGVDYWKIINKQDRFDITHTELKRWTQNILIMDFGKEFVKQIPKYDDFIIEPDNVNYRNSIGNCFNMYSKFAHKPKKGSWKWTETLIKHIFGDQYELGLKYMQALYIYPRKALPVLALLSTERETGKSTFIDYINILFGNNAIIINPQDITSDFNGMYADKNIIAIEETLLEKSASVEKIKSIATQKYMAVNMKHVSHFKIPFFGKIIMASNNEEKFIKVDEDEIRFWTRKINMPTQHNHNILEDMRDEIPAFLYHLSTLPPLVWDKSRMLFTKEEIANDALAKVKESSKSGLYKELIELFKDYYLNEVKNEQDIKFTPTDVKKKWFLNNNTISNSYLKHTFIHDFGLEIAIKVEKYSPFEDAKKSGTPYLLTFKHIFKNCETLDNQEDKSNDDVPY